jgi:hypothetical protein
MPQPSTRHAKRTPRFRGFRRLVLASVLACLSGGFVVVQEITADHPGPPRPPASAARPAAEPDAAQPRPLMAGDPAQPAARPAEQPAALPAAETAALPPSPPIRIVIPKTGTDAPFVGLGLEASGQLAVPDPNDRRLAGWYKDGVAPGSPGTAIVVAHVDTKTGPAAFYGLGTLEPGDTAEITRADGIVATFRVESVELFDKKTFPSARVYADTADAELRMLTCGGSYDKQNGGYQSNVVVFAKLTGTHPA